MYTFSLRWDSSLQKDTSTVARRGWVGSEVVARHKNSRRTTRHLCHEKGMAKLALGTDIQKQGSVANRRGRRGLEKRRHTVPQTRPLQRPFFPTLRWLRCIFRRKPLQKTQEATHRTQFFPERADSIQDVNHSPEGAVLCVSSCRWCRGGHRLPCEVSTLMSLTCLRVVASLATRKKHGSPPPPPHHALTPALHLFPQSDDLSMKNYP
jgi:hypothetical protein